MTDRRQRPIEAIGCLMPVDASGRIVNACSGERPVGHWGQAVDELIVHAKAGLRGTLRSVYLRGSVARGLAVDQVSDIDLICVVSRAPPGLSPQWAIAVGADVRRRHPFCTDVGLRVVLLDWLMGSPRAHSMRFLLKTQGLCVSGTDLGSAWSDYTLADARIVLDVLPGAIREFRQFLLRSPDINWRGIERRCRWIMKKIVRAGLELVADRERAYSRDLQPCWEAFARHYPDQAASMREVLDLAVNPSADRQRIMAALEVGEWVTANDPGAPVRRESDQASDRPALTAD